jgi:hypothetical protein
MLRPVVAALDNVIRQVSGTPEGKAQLAASGIEGVLMTTDEYAAFLRDEVKKSAKLVGISGQSWTEVDGNRHITRAAAFNRPDETLASAR